MRAFLVATLSDAQSVDEEVNEVLRRIKEAYQIKMEQHRLENEKRELKQSNTTITNQYKENCNGALPLTVKDHNSSISPQGSILRISVAPTCSTEIGSELRCDSSDISVSPTNSFNSLDLLERRASDEHEHMTIQHCSELVSNLSMEWELKDVDAGEISNKMPDNSRTDCSDKNVDKSSTIYLIEDGRLKLDDSTSNEERLHEKSCDEKVTLERNNQVRYSLRRRSEQVKFLESDGSENEEDRFTRDMSNSESADESFNPDNENVSETDSSDESASHEDGTKVSKGSKDAQNDIFGNGDIELKQADVKSSILKASENPLECTEIARCHSSNILAPIASKSNTSQNDTKKAAAKKNCTEKPKDKVYELLCPDLEDKWEFMLGEKGTFQRLQQLNVNHSLGYLTVHEDSEAFRKCFEYMEWNYKMRCIYCSQEFELFSDFLLHLFDRNSCEKTIRKKGGFVCIPCEKEGLARTRFIMHMMKAKSHGNLPSAFIPLSTENDEVGKGDDQGRLTSFSAGYRCKVCNNKQRFGLLTAAIDHIKEKHTKEKEKKYVYRKSNSKYGKTTVYAREAKTMYKVDTSQGNGNERNIKEIVNNPDIEDKWMFMFGEEGTFKQLKCKHTCTVNDLCIYEDSEAFRKFSEYMEWNARMRCIFCKQVFDQFSDFLIHFFDANSCDKLPVAVKHKFVCQPCGKFGLKKMSLIRHLLKLKSHVTKDAAYLPKLKDDEELDNGALETFKPGYTCKVCNDSRIWPTVRDGVHHIKVKHTNEIPLPAFFVKRTQKFTKGKVTIDAKEYKRKAKHRLGKYCDKVCRNKKALLGHFSICHKDIANKGKAENSILEENDSLDESTDEDECHRKIKERSKERSATYESRKKIKKRSKERSATYEGREKIKERSKERSATYESRENSSKDNAESLYEVQRPDLEEKWEYMYGEKGTFKKLNGNHTRKPLCVYDDSQAFRECFEYMEWNCRMRCIFCDQEFDLLADFLLHIFDLESCGKSIKARLRGYYACMPCGKDIIIKEGMIRHMLKCETHGTKAAAFIPKTPNDGGDNDQSFIPSFRTGFTCKVCKEPQIWPSLREAVIHIKDAHTLEKQRKFVYRKTIVEKGKVKICVQENQVRLTKCLCSYCGQVCRSQEALFAHLTSFHKEMAADQLSKEQLLCQHCGKEFSIHHKRAFDRHMGFHSGPMPCEICGKVLKNRNAYHRHKIRHKVKEYTCFCGKKFKKRFNYQQHKTHHRLSKEERRHKCDECDKSFIYKHHLTNHIASYHSTERKFKCTACGAKFKLKHHLKQHTDSESACAAVLNDK
ncbi:hypothetical protein FSP39_001754 [Pinctada imbricata]|uniref:C2H2-type domain-containing protein n=1 Tax=Pinctada imbricata TaxID=66713 RepID=A0AA89C2Z0_PINIB|nr:hypothetical protein FSP39_001754 [Pinctada imbricata]